MLGATDAQFNEEQKVLLKAYQKKPKNCAGDFDEPPSKRDATKFVGLKNQGATCYLNSLLQSFYMIPEFRHAILSFPLCVFLFAYIKKLTCNRSTMTSHSLQTFFLRANLTFFSLCKNSSQS